MTRRPGPRSRLPLLGVGAALTIAALTAGADGSAGHRHVSGGAQQEQFVLRKGDTMRVAGTRLGCQVERRDGRLTIECRRSGRLARTYMTVFSERTAEIARFRSRTTAKIVFTARHGAGTRVCAAAARRHACR